MPTLKEILTVPGTRPKVVVDCVALVQEEVDSKGGLTGLAIKGAYAVVKAVKPGFVAEALDDMLDDFADAPASRSGRTRRRRTNRSAR